MTVFTVQCVYWLTELGYNTVLGVTKQHLTVKHVIRHSFLGIVELFS